MAENTTANNEKVSPEQVLRRAWETDVERWVANFLWEFGESGMLHNEGAKTIICALEAFLQSRQRGLPFQIEAPSEIFRAWAIRNGD